MFKKVDNTNVKPCSHMETLVSQYVDGELTGIKRWYTECHIKDCKQCQASIPFFQALRSRTLNMAPPDVTGDATLDDDRWKNIESSWNEADKAMKPE